MGKIISIIGSDFADGFRDQTTLEELRVSLADKTATGRKFANALHGLDLAEKEFLHIACHGSEPSSQSGSRLLLSDGTTLQAATLRLPDRRTHDASDEATSGKSSPLPFKAQPPASRVEPRFAESVACVGARLVLGCVLAAQQFGVDETDLGPSQWGLPARPGMGRQFEQLVTAAQRPSRRRLKALIRAFRAVLRLTGFAAVPHASPPLTRLITQFRTALVGTLTRTAPPLAA